MPTTARLPRAQRRAQLLVVATRVFCDDGFHVTSMDAIAAAAGVTKPVLYQHFGSKEDLYIEVIRALGQEMVDEISRVSDASTPDAQTGEGMHVLSYLLVERGRALHLLETGPAISTAIATAVEDIQDRCAVAVASILTHARVLSPPDATVIGRAIVAIARSSAALVTSAEDLTRRERILDLLAVFLRSGVEGFHARPDLSAPAHGTAPSISGAR